MNDFLKHYQARILALSPIHIGSGSKIGKKEYIYLPWNHQVIIPDLEKMYTAIRKKGLESRFLDFMMREPRLTLSEWLKQNGFRGTDYEQWKRYEMDAGETSDPRARKQWEIQSFMKDPYGMPYVPGSSLKGLFRTALLVWEIQNHPNRYEMLAREIGRNASHRVSRKQCLSWETKQMEQQTFHTLYEDEKNIKNAVKDNLSGLYVGDSEPISTEQLTLSQKIDYTLDGTERSFPLLRETLIPGTEIRFSISVDTTRCPYQIEEIMDALDLFQKINQKYFYSRFHRGATQKGIVWLGGGCGYPSKTILYPMFEQDAVRVIDRIYKNTIRAYDKHKHGKDVALNIAPHVCKCTRYQGRLYDMGMGQITVKEA